MKVALGTLAKSALETQVGPDLPAAVNTALIYHVERLGAGRGAAGFPAFLTTQARSGSGEEDLMEEPATVPARAEIEVQVDERVEAALQSDARRQGVSPTDLAGHAVLAYLAELDRVGAGRPSPHPHRDRP